MWGLVIAAFPSRCATRR